MEQATRKRSKAWKVWNVISWILILLFLFTVLIELIFKFTGRDVYLFGTRFDVVLTDSMSVKNKKYEKFLEGKDQIQAFDLVLSKKVDEKTELNVYDVVLFNNPEIGTDMHRIVNKGIKGDEFAFSNVDVVKYLGQDMVHMNQLSSKLVTSPMPFENVEIVSYSTSPYLMTYNIVLNSQAIQPNIVSKYEDGYYKNTIQFQRLNTVSRKMYLTRNNLGIDSYIQSVSVTLDGGKKYSFAAKDLVDNKIVYNPVEKFEIRGDKADTSDGWYARSELYSKVYFVAPKVGYGIRFLSSIPGIFLLILLALIILIFSYLWEKLKYREMMDILLNHIARSEKDTFAYKSARLNKLLTEGLA